MLVDFLWQNLELIGDFADMKVQDLWKKKEVVSIEESEKTYRAFREMIVRKVSGIAVVDKDGSLVDNISFRDFKGTHSEARTFWKLWDSVKEFKEKIEKESPPAFVKPLYVLETDILSDVVQKMALYHVHRIFVVDSPQNMKPVNVISQSDVLSAILRIESNSRE